MKKLSLIIMLALVFVAGFAQTQFIAIYDFTQGDNSLQSFAYNGKPVNGLTMGPVVKQGVTTATLYPESFYGSGWPTGPSPDLSKYLGFTMNANSGYTFSIDKVYFGLGKRAKGADKAQWRGSADSFADPFVDYDLNYSLHNWDIASELEMYCEVGESHTDIPGNYLLLSDIADYQDVTSCGFRMYMYNAMDTKSISGLWDRVMVVGTVQSTGGPAISTDPSAFRHYDFNYAWKEGPSAAKSFTVTSSGLSGPIQVLGSQNFEVASSASGTYGPTLEIASNMQQTVYLRLKKGLEYGLYADEVIMLHSSSTGYALGAIATGGVNIRSEYRILFERPSEVKPDYAEGIVYLAEAKWNLNEAKIETDPAHVITGARSAVLRGYGYSSMTMLEDHLCGSQSVRFHYRAYGNDTQVPWVLQYSQDEGGSWTQVGQPFTATSTKQSFGANIEKIGPIRFRFIRQTPDSSTNEHRIIIDDFVSDDYYDIYSTYAGYDENGYHIIASQDCFFTPNAVPTPIPNLDPSCVVEIHLCFTLPGSGPWSFYVYNENPIQPDAWVGYKQGANWYFFDFEDVDGQPATLRIYPVKSAEIELLAGYGGNPATLPVTLSHFSATLTAQNYVLLNWVTQSESNVMGYHVYRNTDENLGTAMLISDMIAGTNTSHAQTYVFYDKDLTEEGTYYYWLQNVDLDGTSAFHGPVNVVFSIAGEGGSPSIPTVTQLDNAYPNPFNPNTTIRYQLKDPGKVRIDIYNVRGQIVRSFERYHEAAGKYHILWDGIDNTGKALASGVYLYKMSCGSFSATKKLVLQK